MMKNKLSLFGHEGDFFHKTISNGYKGALVDDSSTYDIYTQINKKLSTDIDRVRYDSRVSPGAGVLLGPSRYLTKIHLVYPHSSVGLMLHPEAYSLDDKVLDFISLKATYPNCSPRNMVDFLLAPSLWAQSIIEKNVHSIPVEVLPLGVDSCFSCKVEHRKTLAASDDFRVLHVAYSKSSQFNTKKLLMVWKDFCEYVGGNANPLLQIMVPSVYIDYVRDLAVKHKARNLAVYSLDDLPLKTYASYLSNFHVQCQPYSITSFGLPVLQALASGVPVLTTTSTGTRSLVNKGLIGIDTSPSLEPLEYSFEYAEGYLVEREAILESLKKAFNGWSAFSGDAIENSKVILNKWSWRNSLEKWKKTSRFV